MPSDSQLSARHGQALLAAGRNKEALPYLRDAVDGGFDAPDVKRSLALALALNELYAESGRLLDDTEAADNGDNEVVSGYLDLKRHNYLEAEATIGGLVQNRPNSPETVNLLAAAIYPQTRFGDAVLLLERAHELDPSLAWVEANLRRARAAKAAEALAENARPVKALPQ
jgi:tetratricopeptide (TPR) repeat protein